MTNAERQKRYRDRKKAQSVTLPPTAITNSSPNVPQNPSEAPEIRANTRIASLEDYHKNPKDYALLACAGLLNWGAPMSESELKAARLSGNRRPIPGDWDYKEGS